MGYEVYTGVAIAKTVLDEHCHLLAMEEPPILSHANDCHDLVGCMKDWYGIWWNGMGCFLLDGRNPQLYDEAVKCFKELHFGQVSLGCKAQMFCIIDSKRAFDYADKFVDDICKQLVHQMIYKPVLSPPHSPL
ncbi:hypothetical protein ID866_10949 [Astraeus odoratus]|nr:hypothetical protein ID866_10949 [Astraeus odoratus]